MTGFLVLARVRRALLLFGLGFAALPVGSALAATTVGQTGGTNPCFPEGGATVGDTNYVVPAGGGTITSFSFQSDPSNAGNQLDFLLLRPVSGSTYTVVGKTGLVTLAGTGLETFPANISAQAGDILGWWSNAGVLPNCDTAVATGGAIAVVFTTDPNTNDNVVFDPPILPFDFNESATLAPPLPTSSNQCKNGGWKTYGTTFKNQGDCVSFVATGAKNPPSGT